MPAHFSYDAVVVGSGPNGLAAAVRLAQEKLSVLVLEANDTEGGGARSGEITLPGFTHDLCPAIHPLAIGSPFFRKLELEKHGLHWIQPEIPLAHPLGEKTAAGLLRSGGETAIALSQDAGAYQRLMEPLVPHWESLSAEFLKPMLHVPAHPIQMARFGMQAIRSAAGLAEAKFQREEARALFAGLAGHSFLPLEERASAAFALVLAMAGHAVGWPLPRGGSQRISDALASLLRSLGGELKTGVRVESLKELPLARAILLDVTPLQLLLMCGDQLPESYQRRLGKFRHGQLVAAHQQQLQR